MIAQGLEIGKDLPAGNPRRGRDERNREIDRGLAGGPHASFTPLLLRTAKLRESNHSLKSRLRTLFAYLNHETCFALKSPQTRVGRDHPEQIDFPRERVQEIFELADGTIRRRVNGHQNRVSSSDQNETLPPGTVLEASAF